MTRELLARAVRHLEENAAGVLASERGLDRARLSVHLVAGGEEGRERLEVLVLVDQEPEPAAQAHLATLLRLAGLRAEP